MKPCILSVHALCVRDTVAMAVMGGVMLAGWVGAVFLLRGMGSCWTLCIGGQALDFGLREAFRRKWQRKVCATKCAVCPSNK